MAEINLARQKEVDLLRRSFKDNEELLKKMRALFFGFPMSEADNKLIRDTFASEELKLVVRKSIFPVLNPDVPIGQVADFWLGTEQNVFGMTKDTIYQAVNSKQEVLAMLHKAMKLLDNPEGDKVSVDYSPSMFPMDELQVNLLARNLYIRTIETGLNIIKGVAETKEETPAEKAKRLKADSTA